MILKEVMLTNAFIWSKNINIFKIKNIYISKYIEIENSSFNLYCILIK